MTYPGSAGQGFNFIRWQINIKRDVCAATQENVNAKAYANSEVQSSETTQSDTGLCYTSNYYTVSNDAVSGKRKP